MCVIKIPDFLFKISNHKIITNLKLLAEWIREGLEIYLLYPIKVISFNLNDIAYIWKV